MRQSRPGRRKQLIAGIDIGTITIAVVLLNSKGTVVFKDYRFHNGNIYAVMEGIIRKLPVKKLITIGVVAEKGREFFSKGIEVNEQVAIIEGVKNYIPDIGSIINIGGENFGLILFNQQGQYEKYISNSACAAGTGSFLDQQAARLGLSGSAELSRLALSYQGVPPQIATRCAVFAKTDLVHMQQQGYKLSAITAGLCRGVAQNICNTLFHGIKLLEPIAVVGGVSKNKRVVEYIAEESRYPLQTLPYGEYIGAIGAAFTAWQQSTVIKKIIPVAVNKLLVRTSFKKKYYY